MPRALVVSSRIFFTLSILSAIEAMIGCGGPAVPSGPSCTGGGFTVHVGDIHANGAYTGNDLQGSAYGNILPNQTGYTGCYGSFGSTTDFLSTYPSGYTLENGYARPPRGQGPGRDRASTQSMTLAG
jgi:hypothetical protein